jgi:hypothetical protein
MMGSTKGATADSFFGKAVWSKARLVPRVCVITTVLVLAGCVAEPVSDQPRTPEASPTPSDPYWGWMDHTHTGFRVINWTSNNTDGFWAVLVTVELWNNMTAASTMVDFVAESAEGFRGDCDDLPPGKQTLGANGHGNVTVRCPFEADTPPHFLIWHENKRELGEPSA